MDRSSQLLYSFFAESSWYSSASRYWRMLWLSTPKTCGDIMYITILLPCGHMCYLSWLEMNEHWDMFKFVLAFFLILCFPASPTLFTYLAWYLLPTITVMMNPMWWLRRIPRWYVVASPYSTEVFQNLFLTLWGETPGWSTNKEEWVVQILRRCFGKTQKRTPNVPCNNPKDQFWLSAKAMGVQSDVEYRMTKMQPTLTTTHLLNHPWFHWPHIGWICLDSTYCTFCFEERPKSSYYIWKLSHALPVPWHWLLLWMVVLSLIGF